MIPNAKAPVLTGDGSLSLPWRLWAQSLTSSADSTPDVTALTAEVASLTTEIATVQSVAETAATDAMTALGETDGAILAALVALSQLDAALGASGVVPGTYGDATHVGVFTVNLQGLLTAASSTAITFPPPTSAQIVAAQGVSNVAGLPAGPIVGQRSFVTDSTVAASSNFGAIVAGTGANAVPVFWDGSNWRIG